MFYTYVLVSLKDYKLYVGYTDNLRKRFREHQEGLIQATQLRRPLKLVYYEACLRKTLALGRKKYFKKGFGRRFLKDRLEIKDLPLILGT